jgi:hypothetical protein
MTKVRDYFKDKYDKNGPAYLQGVLRTLGKMPHEDEESVPDHDEAKWEQTEEVVEK